MKSLIVGLAAAGLLVISCAQVVTSAAVDDVIKGLGPEAYWRLGETGGGSGTIAHDETTSHNGTYNNGVTLGQTGLPGAGGDTAARFDETDDHVLIPDFDYTTDPAKSNFTVGFGLKVSDNSGTGFQYMFSHGEVSQPNSINVYFCESGHASSGTLRTVIRDTDDAIAPSIEVAPGLVGSLWHYCMVTASATAGTTVYVDGLKRAQNTAQARDGFNPTTGIFLASREDKNADRYYGGLLDEVAIFSKPLTDDEVLDVAIAALGGRAKTYYHQSMGLTPEAYWRLGESGSGTNTTAYDETVSHNGTYKNGVTLEQPGPFVGDTSNTAAGFTSGTDHVVIPDFNYGNHDGSGEGMTIAFWFNSDDNSGTAYQYMFSHGAVGDFSSINVWFREDQCSGGAGELSTRLRDVNDAAGELVVAPGLADQAWHLSLYPYRVSDRWDSGLRGRDRACVGRFTRHGCVQPVGQSLSGRAAGPQFSPLFQRQARRSADLQLGAQPRRDPGTVSHGGNTRAYNRGPLRTRGRLDGRMVLVKKAKASGGRSRLVIGTLLQGIGGLWGDSGVRPVVYSTRS